MRKFSIACILAGLSAACALPAQAQYQRLMDQSVQLAGQGRYAAAAETAEAALKDAEAALGPEHLDVALALNNLAEFQLMAAFVSRNQTTLAAAVTTAEPLHYRALAIREKSLGPRHSFTLASMINLARDYSLERRYDDAEALYKRALGILGEMPTGVPVLADLNRQAEAGLRQIDKMRAGAAK